MMGGDARPLEQGCRRKLAIGLRLVRGASSGDESSLSWGELKVANEKPAVHHLRSANIYILGGTWQPYQLCLGCWRRHWSSL